MKSWIKRTLIATAGAAVLAGGLSACGHHGPQQRGGWSDERVVEMRGRAVERIAGRLELNAEQKAKLEVLADAMMAQRKALRGEGADPRAQIKALVAGEKFDRAGAQSLLEQKTRAVQGQAPKVIDAMADFYDSLTPQQQAKVRERLEKGGRHGWGRG